MHKPEFTQGNETHKVLWDFKIQKITYLGQITRPSESQQKKRNLPNRGFRRPGSIILKKAEREMNT